MINILNSNDHILKMVLSYCSQKTIAEASQVSYLWWSVAAPMLYKAPILYNELQALKFILTLSETFIYPHRWDPQSNKFIKVAQVNCSEIERSDQSPEMNTESTLRDSAANGKRNNEGSYNKEYFFMRETESEILQSQYEQPEAHEYTAVMWPSMIVYSKIKATKAERNEYYCVERKENSEFFRKCVLPHHPELKVSLEKRLEAKSNPEITRKLLSVLPIPERAKRFQVPSFCNLVESFDISMASYRWYWMKSSTASMLLQYLTSLKNLDFSSCANVHIPDLYKWLFSYSDKLKYLSFENLNVGDEFCNLLSKFCIPSLREINLSKSYVTDSGIEKISYFNLPQLESVYLDDLEIGDASVEKIFAEFPRLKYISIEGTMAFDSIPAVLELNSSFDWVNIDDSESEGEL